MAEDIPSIISGAEDHMTKAIGHLEAELVKIRAGKANPQMLDGIVVDLNLEVKERGDEFDYKSDLKSPQKTAQFANKLLSTYKKDVIRKKASTIAQSLI